MIILTLRKALAPQQIHKQFQMLSSSYDFHVRVIMNLSKMLIV